MFSLSRSMHSLFRFIAGGHLHSVRISTAKEGQGRGKEGCGINHAFTAIYYSLPILHPLQCVPASILPLKHFSFSHPHPSTPTLLLVVDINNLLHLIIRTHKDTALVVDRLWDDLHHALHLGVDCLSAGCSFVSTHPLIILLQKNLSADALTVSSAYHSQIP